MVKGRSIPDGLRTILIIAVLGLVAVFVIQNAATVEVNFLAWGVKLPQAVLYFVIFVLGAIVGWLTRFFGNRSD